MYGFWRMFPKRIPIKPDRYQRGGIYLCHLPKQLVTETTDGIAHSRDGVERHGSPPCVVISTDDFNDGQANGFVVVPLISGVNVDLAKFKKVPSSWVRVISQGEPGYVLVEQVRYIDRSRCKAKIGELVDYDLRLVEFQFPAAAVDDGHEQRTNTSGNERGIVS
jgi:mRNA-degrading endonuclease toxin of MazEF toxin-antitoxin module